MVGINKNMREPPSWTPRVESKSVSAGMNAERKTLAVTYTPAMDERGAVIASSPWWP